MSQANLDQYSLRAERRRIVREDEHIARLRRHLSATRNDLKKVKDPADKITINRFIVEQERLLEQIIQREMAGFEPISLLLFDELEKADAALHNFLLEITSKGRTRLRSGQEVNLRNCFVIMTSNIGSDRIADTLRGRGSIGFDDGLHETSEYPVYDAVMRELKRAFRPEFIGRVKQDIVVFRPLSRNEMARVRDMIVDELLQKLFSDDFSIELCIDPEVLDYILEEAMDNRELGARLIKNKVDSNIEEPLAFLINSGQIVKGDTVNIIMQNGKINFTK